jgi:hypothetical protein
MSSNCIIRKLVWKYSLIDAYPKHFMDRESDSEESTHSGNGESNISMGFGNKSDQDAFVFQRIMEALPPNKLLLLLGQEERELASDSDSESDSESDSQSESSSPPTTPAGPDSETSSPTTAPKMFLNEVPDPDSEPESSSPPITPTDPDSETSSPTTAPKMFLNEVPDPVPLAINTTPRTNTKKKVRFAVGNYGGVQVATRFFEKDGNRLQLWWTRKEMKKIQKDCVLLIDRYKSRYPAYIASVSAILEMTVSSEQDAVKELQVLVEQYDARGLEQHIVNRTGILLKHHVGSVLEEAQLLREEERLHGVEGGETLREKSLQTSRQCRLLAEKLAECDVIKCNADRRVPSQSKLRIREKSVGKDRAPPPQKSCCVIS